MAGVNEIDVAATCVSEKSLLERDFEVNPSAKWTGMISFAQIVQNKLGGISVASQR